MTEEVDLRNLQDKFHALLDHRNQHNDLAREARDARNLLNDQRREKSETIDKHKVARDELNDKMRAHKDLRNAFQDQAKALIGERKGKSGAVSNSVPLQLRKVRNEIQNLLEKQETTVLTPAKETELVEKVRNMRREMKTLEAQMGKQDELKVDLSDTDKAIDELFAKADSEHQIVVALQKEASEHHLKFVEAVKEVRVIAAEADEKHKAFVALRVKADDYHNKAMELREKVMAVRGEKAADAKARRDEIRDVNTRARGAVSDKKAMEKVTEDSLEQLKKGGKIQLGF